MALSLKRRLILSLLGLTLFAWIASAALTGIYASRVLTAQVDRQLEQYSQLVHYITEMFARQMEQGLPLAETWLRKDLAGLRQQAMVIDTRMSRGLSPALNIWLDGILLATLENAPRFEHPEQAGFSFRHAGPEGNLWRLLARHDASSDLWILVGIEVEAARWALLETLARALFPLLVVLPLTIALLYFGVARGLKPLQSLATQISQRNSQQLDPVIADPVPVELTPVVAALNELLQRLGSALEAEQRFTANAAHELLTPLAAIKAEVQLCQRQTVEAEGSARLARIAARVDRAGHTVEQLLTLARLDPESPRSRERVPLSAMLAEVLAETAHLAVERSLQVDVQAAPGVRVAGNSEALAILLRNLLVNAFRYATEGSRVTLRLEAEPATPGEIKLTICNDCPALPAVELARLTDRFYRPPGSAGLGAGLGLSIVSRIAQLHDAKLQLSAGEDGAGFCARMRFPPSDQLK